VLVPGESVGTDVVDNWGNTVYTAESVRFRFAKEDEMAVAKVSEISATSTKSFEDAIQQGLTRAAKTLRHIRGAWVKEHQVRCDGAHITEYQVNMMVTFVLDD
jgi:dodecin